MEVDTIAANMRDSFLASKGINTNETFDVTQELCFEFQNFRKINQDQGAMIFEKPKSQGNCSFWIEQRYGLITGSNFYRICLLKLKGGHEKETSAIAGTVYIRIWSYS